MKKVVIIFIIFLSFSPFSYASISKALQGKWIEKADINGGGDSLVIKKNGAFTFKDQSLDQNYITYTGVFHNDNTLSVEKMNYTPFYAKSATWQLSKNKNNQKRLDLTINSLSGTYRWTFSKSD